jgi:hypothetical protein
MASAFQFGYGNPDNYSDWAGYAGLDRKTGDFGAVPPSTAPVQPPATSVGELYQQKVAAPMAAGIGKVQSAMNSAKNSFNQLSQGNVVGAVTGAQAGEDSFLNRLEEQ